MNVAAKAPSLTDARVVITGIGVVAPNGIGKDAFWENSRAGKSGIKAIDRFDTSTYSCHIAGQVDGFRAAEYVDRNIVKQTDRSTHMALAACGMATADARLDLSAEDPEQVGMYFANIFGGMEFAERELYAQHRIGPDRVSAYQAIAWFYAATQGQWSISKGLKGFGKSIVADRVGGHQALLLGALAIRQGHARVIYAGGFEAPVAPYVLRIHETSRLLSTAVDDPESSYRPFDAGRTGLVLAEGSGVVILEDEWHARERGATIYAELAGGAITCDGRDALVGEKHLARCLAEAVANSGLRPEQVNHVIAEGIGVREHDFREAAAIARVFGDGETTVSVPKARTGHALAAGGAIDAIWAALMLSEGCLLEPVNLTAPDTGVPLKLANRNSVAAKPEAILCCGSGFGGVNTAIVLRRFEGDDA